MTAAALPMHEDLALAEAAAAPAPVIRALAGGDPLRLDLPPAPGLQAAPEALKAMSALYLAARVEETGLLQAAEILVQQRAVLRVPATTGAKLEDMARRAPRWYSRDQRALLYARLFGLGPSAATDPSGGGSRFEPLLAALCSAIAAQARSDVAHYPGAVALAGADLATTAGNVYGGAMALAVPRLNDQLRRAIDVLADPGVGTLVRARGLWQTLQRLLEPNVPDIRRLLECGRHGQRILFWLATALPALQASPAGAAQVTADVAVSAEAWLAANGLPVRAQEEGSI
jgi:hypothetical protein